MRIRALDNTGDWTYGKGQNNYKSKNNAVGQKIQTRLMSFLGDCFFDLGAGVDWFGFLGGKDQLALDLAVSAVILNTTGVTGIQQLSLSLNENTRKISISYKVQTVYSALSQLFVYDLAA